MTSIDRNGSLNVNKLYTSAMKYEEDCKREESLERPGSAFLIEWMMAMKDKTQGRMSHCKR
jgi:hypothetical protein